MGHFHGSRYCHRWTRDGCEPVMIERALLSISNLGVAGIAISVIAGILLAIILVIAKTK